MALGFTLSRRVGNKWLTDILGPGATFAADYWSAQGVISTGRRPSIFTFRGDTYLVGCYSKVVYRPKQDQRYLVAGIKAPTKRLTVALGSGSGGDEGNAVMYTTFLHKQGDLILAESDPSNYVTLEGITGQGFVWSNIQDEGADMRVTHVRGYRSMNGSDYRMAWEAPYGITSFFENTRLTYLLDVGPVDHGQPPSGLYFGVEFAGRGWYARTTEHPYRLWASEPGNPQYVGELSYRDTPDRAAITGIAKGKNELIVFCRRSTLLVRAFDQNNVDDDWVLQRLDSSVGCVSHWGIVEIHNKLWFPAEDGVWLYDGSFYYAMKDMRPYWRDDYLANKGAFSQGFAADDIVNKVYVFKTPRDPAQLFEGIADVGTVDYVGSYELFERTMGGTNDQPDWSLDLKGRRDSSILFDEDGNLLVGSCDGKIRRHDEADGDDDGDTVQKRLVIRHGHALFFDPGDDIEGGKTITNLWAYVESELNAWTLYLLGGDEDAWRQIRPDNGVYFWTAPVVASEKEELVTLGGDQFLGTWAAKSVHFFTPEKVSGRGMTLEIQAVAPIGMKYRGYGGLYKPGPAFRPLIQVRQGFELRLYHKLLVAVDWTEVEADPLTGEFTIEVGFAPGGDLDRQVKVVVSPLTPLVYDFDVVSAIVSETGNPTGFPVVTDTIASPDTEYIFDWTQVEANVYESTIQIDVTDGDSNPSENNPSGITMQIVN
jgi:hypothetical protein